MAIFFIAVIIGLIPASIAKNKGRNFFLWWLYGAAIFIVALPHTLLMDPSKNAPGKKKCPKCAEIINSEAKVCPHCGASIPTKINANEKLYDDSSGKLSKWSPKSKWGLILLTFFMPYIGFWFVRESDDFSDKATIISGIWMGVVIVGFVSSLLGSSPPKYIDAAPFESNAALYSSKLRCLEGEAEQADIKVPNGEGVEIIQGEEEDTCAKVRILTGDYEDEEGWMSPMWLADEKP